jgi:amidase
MDGSELVLAGLARQAELIRDGEVSPRELVEACLERIATLDPRLRSFRVVMAERALAEADQAQARLRAGGERPLLGVPVAIKDDTDVAGELTTMGSGAHGGPARADAEVVRRLREAGAVIIGKTTCSELVAQPFTETVAWGTTHNPWDLDRTPGGSSGGSAAAVAGGLVGGALGSDGGGSIRVPASCCGLFGLKVQRDRIPLAPIREFWHGLAVYGPLVRHVRDAALFLDATADRRGGEPFSAAAARPPGRLRIALSLKVPPGITAVFARLDAEVRRAIEETAALLRRLGHEVVERDPDYGMVTNDFTARYLRGVHDDAERMPRPRFLELRTKRLARLGGAIPAAAVARVRAAEAQTTARINAVFEDCDVVLSPVMPVPPLEIGRYEGRGMLRTLIGSAAFVAYCPAWNAVGNPSACVPAGLTASELPIGAQLAGRPGDEATLLSLSAQLEAERPWADRRPPIS